MTEGGPTSVLNAAMHPDKLHTVGKPAAGCDIRIIDENDKELPQGAVGEIVGASSINTDGYLNREDATNAAQWVSPDGKSFHRSGDLGCFDADGFLEIRGRKKDMINSGGYNIYPSDIEEVLRRHPFIIEAAVVAAPSEKWGESPYGFISMPDAAGEADMESILRWANDLVSPNQRLVGLERRDVLPRNDLGKVLKAELRKALWLAPS